MNGAPSGPTIYTALGSLNISDSMQLLIHTYARTNRVVHTSCKRFGNKATGCVDESDELFRRSDLTGNVSSTITPNRAHSTIAFLGLFHYSSHTCPQADVRIFPRHGHGVNVS